MRGTPQIYTPGPAAGYTGREVADACRRVTGHPSRTADGDGRPGDPPSLVASGRRAAERLSWTPRHDLDRIVADAWACMSQ